MTELKRKILEMSKEYGFTHIGSSICSADMTKVLSEFGQREFVSLEDGLKRIINWQLKNLYE